MDEPTKMNAMEFITEHWMILVPALMAFARVVVSLLPTESPAVPIFGLIDKAITAIVGDARKKPQKPTDPGLMP